MTITVRITTLVMGKISYEDKMRIQTLRELGFGYRTIVAKFPGKGWNVWSVKAVCKRVDERESATERKPGSGRPKTARTEENIERVAELICSQEDQLGTSKSMRHIAKDIAVSQGSVRRIAKDLNLSAFRRVPAQVISDATKAKRLERCLSLIHISEPTRPY